MRNRGELAEGWYDPATLDKAQASLAATEKSFDARPSQDATRQMPASSNGQVEGNAELSSDEDDFGPTLPGKEARHQRGHGPVIPRMDDLDVKRELEQEDHQMGIEDLRASRKIDRKVQKERLEELVPRAEAGSKDRMLEKKREKADSNRAFAAAKTETGGVDEVAENDLLGDDDGGIEGLKKLKKLEEKKKTEREVRKEEILRARKEEREERIRVYQEKEERTMSGLVALARSKFG